MSYLTPYNLHAQDYLFHQLRIEDGLSQSTILASLQDINGYMWFATRSGLNRYDRYKFVVFLNDPNDTTSISDDAINSLFEDKDGTLWIGIVNGNLNKYDRFTESFKYKNVSSLIENFPEQTVEFYEYPLSFSRNQSSTITTITEDVSGNLWVGTWGNGILQIDKNFKKLNHFYADTKNKNGMPTNRIMSLHFDDHENLWIATFGGGLSKLNINKNGDKNKFIFENYSVGSNQFSLIDSKLLTLFQDSEKNLWIGSYYDGISFIEHSQLRLPPGKAKIKNLLLTTTKNNVSANTVMALAEDNYKNLLIGTFGDGLIRYNKTKNELLHFYNEPLNINSLGEEVIKLVDEIKPAGIYEAEFNASELQSVIYIYRIQRGKYVSSRKALLIK
jgi:ligand-binding sensor domain-containing protein